MSDAIRWAKELMNKTGNAQQHISEAYKETLRFMISMFSAFKVKTPEEEIRAVRCFYANAERAIAKINNENNINLPVITISHEGTDDDDNRRRNNTNLVVDSVWDDTKKRAFRVVSMAPKPVNISYGIHVWTKYKEDMDQLSEQIRLLFSPNMVVTTKYSNSTAAFIKSENEESSLDVGDRQDRILRKTFKVNVEGYIPYPKYLITSTGEIESFNVDTEILVDPNVSVEDDYDSSSINSSETINYTKNNG